MMQVISALKGFGIIASDGELGTVEDFLFDDMSWSVRWLVVECGTWRHGRKILIHPSAISTADFDDQRFEVRLTKAQVADVPELIEDLPVSRQMEEQLYNYYGLDPEWGAPYLGGALGAMASPLMGPPFLGFRTHTAASDAKDARGSDDPHLRSYSELVGYRIHATDGDIGHVENLMLQDTDWTVRYFVVDTRHWWVGAHVLISPAALIDIDWFDHHIHLNVSREQIKASPPWDPLVAFNQVYSKQLHSHYGWPGSQA